MNCTKQVKTTETITFHINYLTEEEFRTIRIALFDYPGNTASALWEQLKKIKLTL